MVYDPCIGQWDYVQEDVPMVPYVKANANMFGFNETFVEELGRLHEACGYEQYLAEYMTFPAKGVQPTRLINTSSDNPCDLFDLVSDEATRINPCFDIYEINTFCPTPWDVLSEPSSVDYFSPYAWTVYFDRPDVKKAMHAPLNVTWSECSENSVFVAGSEGPQAEGDLSANPTEHVLPQVIEATNRVLIANGDFDMIIITNGKRR